MEINSIPGTPQTPKSETDSVSSSSTGKSNTRISLSSTSKEKVHARYLKASTGSCHDYCKYGKKHEFAEDGDDVARDLTLSHNSSENMNFRQKMKPPIYPKPSSQKQKEFSDHKKVTKLGNSTSPRQRVNASDVSSSPNQKPLGTKLSPKFPSKSRLEDNTVDGEDLETETTSSPKPALSRVPSRKLRRHKALVAISPLKNQISVKISVNMNDKITRELLKLMDHDNDSEKDTPEISPTPYTIKNSSPLSSKKQEEADSSIKPALRSSISSNKGIGLKPTNRPTLLRRPSMSLRKKEGKDSAAKPVLVRKPSLSLKKREGSESSSRPILSRRRLSRKEDGTESSNKPILLRQSSRRKQDGMESSHRSVLLRRSSLRKRDVSQPSQRIILLRQSSRKKQDGPESSNKPTLVRRSSLRKRDGSESSKKNPILLRISSRKREDSTSAPKNSHKKKANHTDSKNSAPRMLKFRPVKEISPPEENNVPRILRFRPARILSGKMDAGRRSFKRMKDGLNGIIHEAKGMLKHQKVKEKKDITETSNPVIEEIAKKLAQTEGSRVRSLIYAYETLIVKLEKKPITSS